LTATLRFPPESDTREALPAARAVAIALAAARAVPRGRVTIVTAPDNSHGGRRAVIISLGFAGDRQ